MCTLTYMYSDSTAVIGALSERCEPHAYDLCGPHADRLTAPRGWRVLRLEPSDAWNRDDPAPAADAARGDLPLARCGAPEPDRPDGATDRPVLRDVSLPREHRDPPTAGSAEFFGSAPMPPEMRRAHLRHP